MKRLCATVLFFVLLSFSVAQFLEANVQIDGFSCQPLSLFRFECNLCQCNLFGSSARCIPVECPLERPENEEKPMKKPAKLCIPGQKKLQDGCIECVCTANSIWACSDRDCKQSGNVNNPAKKSKKQYSYECYKTIEQTFLVCESKTTVCGSYLLQVNSLFFFAPKFIVLDSFCMKPSCAVVTVSRNVGFACPKGDDTLDLDDTDAEVIPVTTTTSPEAESSTTERKMRTTVKPHEATPGDATMSPKDVETSTTTKTTTNDPEGIDASVEMMTTTEGTAEDTKIDDINDSGEVPRDVIEDSGESFTQEEFDSEGLRCKPSMSFKVECNTCWCKADGKGARYCTRNECKTQTINLL